MNKTELRRQRRMKKTRGKIRTRGRTADIARLSVHISLQHIYAQVSSADGSRVIAAVSTLDKEIAPDLQGKVNKTNAAIIGKRIAQRTKTAGVQQVAFDRGGRKYHGRVKALAEAAREEGLIF